jgi:aspartate ammonia-lyase
VAEIGRSTGLELKVAIDPFEAIQSRFPLARFSGALRQLALELIRVANDMRLLGSGPTAGLHELRLPPVQPGSSIMPGKANPVMAECLDMIGFHLVGMDVTVALATQAGQLELNVMTPVIAYHLLFGMSLLTNFLPRFTTLCVEGMTADEERCRSYFESTPALATVLNPVIGYMKAAEVAKAAVDEGKTIREVVLEKGILGEEELDELLAPERLCDVLEECEEPGEFS